MKYALFGLCALVMAAAAEAGIGDKLPPEAYVDPIDQQIARTGVGVPGRPVPCAREERQNGFKVIVGRPTDRCVRMLPQQRWKGLWRFAFEGSRFCPTPAKTCDRDTPGERIWLSGGPGKRGRGELYRVDFIGRRTMYKGAYGHMGISDHEVIIDRVNSMKLIWAPPPPSKPDRAAMLKQCLATPECRENEQMMKALQEKN